MGVDHISKWAYYSLRRVGQTRIRCPLLRHPCRPPHHSPMHSPLTSPLTHLKLPSSGPLSLRPTFIRLSSISTPSSFATPLLREAPPLRPLQHLSTHPLCPIRRSLQACPACPFALCATHDHPACSPLALYTSSITPDTHRHPLSLCGGPAVPSSHHVVVCYFAKAARAVDDVRDAKAMQHMQVFRCHLVTCTMNAT